MPDKNSKLNIGIIGCGRISDLHQLGYIDNPHAGIYAVCDNDKEAAQEKKTAWAAEKVYTDYREMLQDPAVDAVEILTPQALHEPMAVAAAKAGKHISLQKPMTTTLRSTDAILEAVAASDIVFRVSDNYLFYPPIVLARKMIDQGDIGTPSNIRIKMISGGDGGWEVPSSAWEWRLAEKEAGRGLQTFDHGHHIWATAWYLMGDFQRVSAWIDTLDGIVDSPAVIMWKHTEGPRYGTCEYVFAPDMHIPSQYYANDEWIEISGSKGLIKIRRCTGEIDQGPGLSLFDGQGWTHVEDIETDWSSGFVGATHNFINAVRGVEAPLLSGEQGRDLMKINLAIAKSSQKRREVYVDEMDKVLPWLYTRRCIAGERRKASGGSGLLQKLKPGSGDARYASRADELTRVFVERFDKEAAGNWQTDIGLHLLAEGGAEASCYSLFIRDGKATLADEGLPEQPEVVLKVEAGTWAAVLLKKKHIETALLQGRLKVEGKAEVALKLRKVFGL